MAHRITLGLRGREVHFKCERCGEPLAAQLAEAGDTDKCPACAERFTVPGAEDLERMRAEAAETKRRKEERRREAAETKAAKRAEKRALVEAKRREPAVVMEPPAHRPPEYVTYAEPHYQPPKQRSAVGRAMGAMLSAFASVVAGGIGVLAGVFVFLVLCLVFIYWILSAAVDSVDSTDRAMAEARARPEARSVPVEVEPVENAGDAYIAEHVEVYDIHAAYMDSILDGRVPGVRFKVRNDGDRTIRDLRVTFFFQDAGGQAIAEHEFAPLRAGAGLYARRELQPGYIWEMDDRRFLQPRGVPSEWEEGKVEVAITGIELD